MTDEAKPPIEIPAASLDAELLNAVIESFVLREGTDYGAVEIGLETKIRQVRSQIQKGEVGIFFDPESESVTLVRKT